MGNRLSKIYTRTGDHGETGLGDGSRVGKDSLRVSAYGSSDELNSVIGLLICEDQPDHCRTVLIEIQHHLFDMGAELCVPGHQVLTQAHVDWLESVLDKYNADLPALKEFILPGGGRAAAQCHVARTVCRRVEREVVGMGRNETLPPFSAKYLNRLSDLLFVLGRVYARHSADGEVLWQPKRPIPAVES